MNTADQSSISVLFLFHMTIKRTNRTRMKHLANKQLYHYMCSWANLIFSPRLAPLQTNNSHNNISN